jgi:hypothetical protein
MVDQFDRRIGYQGLTSEEMQAVCAELKGEPGELDDEKFDVVVVRISVLFWRRMSNSQPIFFLVCFGIPSFHVHR